MSHLKEKPRPPSEGTHRIVAADDEDEVAGLCTHGLLHGVEHLGGVEFVHAALDVAVGFDAGIDQALGTNLRRLDEVGQFVEHLARIVGAARGADTADVGRVVEDGKRARALEHVHEFDKLHAEARAMS